MNKKLYIFLTLIIFSFYLHGNVFDSLKRNAAAVVAKAKTFKQKAHNEMAKDWEKFKIFAHLENKTVPCCTDFPEIHEPSIYQDLTDPLNRVIAENCPVIYLHSQERAYPMSGLRYFEHPKTQIVYQKNHEGKNKDEKQIIIPKGKVTSEKIYQLSKERTKDNDLFAEIPKCIESGEDPSINRDADGNLTTTAYVKTKIMNDKLYISYIFFYGFNYPYQLKLPVFRIPLPPGQILNAHECDIEHITQEFEILDLDNNQFKLSRIFYSTHGSAEGMWLNVNDPNQNPEHITVEFEGTHPVVYAAKGGHGAYPEEGTYVRIFGFANDRTEKGIRWTPDWKRLYEPNEERFDPTIHGWVMLPGENGPRGVTSLGYKEWFKNPTSELNDGNPKNRHFCPNPGTLKHDLCVRIKTPVAAIPKK